MTAGRTTDGQTSATKGGPAIQIQSFLISWLAKHTIYLLTYLLTISHDHHIITSKNAAQRSKRAIRLVCVSYLSECDGQVDLDDFDLEQIVESLEDPHLNQVVSTSESLEQLETLLKHRLQAAVLLLHANIQHRPNNNLNIKELSNYANRCIV